MSRYVDIEPYEKCVLQRYYRDSMGECVETVPLCGLPTADVQEVRHGRWELYDICSVCGAQAEQQTNYCPNCGSRMDLEGDIE